MNSVVYFDGFVPKLFRWLSRAEREEEGKDLSRFTHPFLYSSQAGTFVKIKELFETYFGGNRLLSRTIKLLTVIILEA